MGDREITEKRKRFIINTLYFALILGMIVLFFRYLFGLVLPFLIGLTIVFLIQPLVNRLYAKLHINKKASSLVLVLLLMAAISFLLYMLGVRVVHEAQAMGKSVPAMIEALPSQLDALANWASETIGSLPKEIEAYLLSIREILLDYLGELPVTISKYVLNASTTFVSKLPNAVVAIFMGILATCFIALDFDRIKGFIVRQFRDNHLDTMVQVKDIFSQSVIRYIKSYAIILLITFTEAAVGLTIIGVDYAILISFLIAVVDILPVLGTGTVMIPWMIVCFITGDIPRGVGLLVVYLIITVVRQIIEPKIVSQNVGLHPLVTLMSMYIGAKLLGIVGLFGFPITVIILQSLNESGRIHLWKVADRDLGAKNRNRNWKKKFFIRENGTKGEFTEPEDKKKKP